MTPTFLFLFFALLDHVIEVLKRYSVAFKEN